MIDTDKYEGHTQGVWTEYNAHSVGVKGDTNHSNHRIAIMDLKPEADVKQAEHIANRKLIADAPKLLAEVKRLRGLLHQVADEYTDADGITYEIYCEFGGEEE